MNITTRQLRAFTAVARLGSFTRAAQQIHMTQAGLSGIVREFETQVGQRLFDRTTRTVTLTASGAALLPIATQVLQSLEGASAILDNIGSAERRTLTVATTPMLSSTVLPGAIRAFAITHPYVSVNIRDLDRSEIQGQVDAGHVDAGFGVFLGAAVGIDRVPLLKLPLLLAAPEEDKLPKSVSWKKLQGAKLVALAVDNPVQRVIDEQLGRIGQANEERLCVNNFNTLLAMVEATFGRAIVPSFARLGGGYKVNFAELTEPRIGLDFYQITRKGRSVNPALEEFSRTLKGILSTPVS